MNLLKKIPSVFQLSHREGIKAVFETLKKQLPQLTPREAEFEANRLSRKVGAAGGGIVSDSRLATAGDRISSADHNENMEGAFVDLNALYKETANINAVHEAHKTALDSDYSKARAGILKLINDARVYAIRNQNPEFDDIKVIDFNIATNSSKRSPIATIDQQTRLLKLPELQRRRNHLRRRGVRSTSVSAEVQAEGQVGQIGRQFSPENAVDSKVETFWGEVIYTDGIFENIYSRWSPNDAGELYDIVQGPVTKLRLSFSNAEAINQVKVLPFSNFPVKILEVTYRSTKSSQLRYPIEGFQTEESLDWIEYNFETIFAVDVEIVFAQESYRTFTVKVPKHVLFATDFMLRFLETRQSEFSNNLPVLGDILVGGNSSIYSDALDDLATLVAGKDLEKLPSTEIDLAGKTIMSIGESMAVFNPELKSLVEEVSSYTEAIPREIKEEIETFNKYEYVVGAREVECNHVTYSPIGFYESPRLEPASTVTNIQLEVAESHPEFQSNFGDFRKTSTEWEVEFAEDRRVPIYPRNFSDEGLYPVKSEFLDIDKSSKTGLTRFPSQLSFATLRENGNLLVAGQDYITKWNDDFDGKLQIGVTGTTYDSRKVYTVDYFAKPTAAEVDVLDKFSDKPLPTPESYENTGPDNELVLENFPFVNYGVINSTGFSYSPDTAAYEYNEPTGSYTTGYAIINPTWYVADGAVVPNLTGSVSVAAFATGDVDANPVRWDTLDSTYLNDPYRWYLKIENLPGAIFEVSSFDGASGLTLLNTPELFTGVVGDALQTGFFSGNVTGQITGELTGFLTVPYSLEVVYKDGDQIFGFDNLLYEPINVSVGGVKALNITSYDSLEQPAFTISNQEDGEYEYIHDGKNLYFNQSIDGLEVLVDYRWMTKYIKVNCLMRTNKIVSPTITPQIDEYRLYLNTTVL